MTGSEVIKEDVKATTDNAIKVADDAGVKASVVADKKTVTVNGEETTIYDVKSLTLDFFGSKVEKDNHSAINNNKLFWDKDGVCDLNDWNFTVLVDDGKTASEITVYGQDIKTSTYAYTKDCEAYKEAYKCALIKAITAKIDGIEVTEDAKVAITVSFKNSDKVPTDVTLTLSINAKGNLVVAFNANDAQFVHGYDVVYTVVDADTIA